jgi:hypothetical protein
MVASQILEPFIHRDSAKNHMNYIQSKISASNPQRYYRSIDLPVSQAHRSFELGALLTLTPNPYEGCRELSTERLL